MKYLHYILLSIILLTSCKEKLKDSFIIEGKIKNLSDPALYVVVNGSSTETLAIDTIYCSKEGKFIYEGHSDSIVPIIVYMEQGTVWTTVWAKDGNKVTLSGDALFPELILAKGGEVNDLLTKFKEQNKDLLKESRELSDRHPNDTVGIGINNMENASKLSNINYQLREKAEDFIKLHSASIASLVLLQDYLIDYGDPELLNQYLRLINGEASKYPLYDELVQLNEQIRRTTIGATAPSFSLLSINKDTLDLNKFKGKYLLLSFATSKCVPCEEENNELVWIRKKYNNNQLEIITISLDLDSAAWQKTIKDNDYSWHQVIDNKSWDSEIASLYNITSIPYNLLIDTNNVIIAKNLASDSLMKFLNEKIK